MKGVERDMPGMPLKNGNVDNLSSQDALADTEKNRGISEIGKNGGFTEKKLTSVHDLKGRSCYFFLAGDLALKAYKELALSAIRKEQRVGRLKRDVLQRLYYSVLMFDIVLMHCSDPLRSEMILEILSDHKDWIEKGHVAFIYASNIYDVKTDYRKYIQRKIQEYSLLDSFCEPEMNSLKQDHMTDQYYDKVISLLDASNYIIRKPLESEYKFTNFVQSDLNSEVGQIVISSKPTDRASVDAASMTLYQLMNVKYIDKSTGKLKPVFPESIIEEVLETIEEHLDQGIMVARSAVVSMIEDCFEADRKRMNRQQASVLNAITLRMDILYCKMNSGKCLILEFHPSYEPHSSYQIKYFFQYCKKIGRKNTRLEITKKLVDQILSCNKNEVVSFRECYLACVSDARELMQLNGVKDAFGVAMENNNVAEYAKENFKAIADILEGMQ